MLLREVTPQGSVVQCWPKRGAGVAVKSKGLHTLLSFCDCCGIPWLLRNLRQLIPHLSGQS